MPNGALLWIPLFPGLAFLQVHALFFVFVFEAVPPSLFFCLLILPSLHPFLSFISLHFLYNSLSPGALADSCVGWQEWR